MPLVVLTAASLLRLAIYYGYPTLVEQSGGDVTRAAKVFAAYDVIVFGDGLELAPDGRDAGLDAERRRMGALIAAVRASPRRPRVYGYIDLGNTQQLPLAEIERRIELWRAIGADGIFFDEAGADFGVGPERLGAALRAVHARGLSAFLNAFNPDDLFKGDDGAPPSRRAPHQVGPNDLLLVESFAVRLGVLEPPDRTAARAAAAVKWRRQTGARVFAVTTSNGQPFSPAQFDHTQKAAAAAGLDGVGWGEANFSADSRLPLRWP